MTDLQLFPFPAGTRGEPPAEYARIRQEPGLPRVRLSNGRQALVVTRYHDVRLVLSDSRFSRSAFTSTPLFARTTESLALNTADAPEHGRRRGAVAHAFTARQVRRMRPMVERVIEEQIAEVAAGPRPADLVDRFTVPFTLRVMCRILGVPEDDIGRFKPWVDPMMSVGRFPADTVARCHREMNDYFTALVEDVRAALDAGRTVPGLIAEMLTPRKEERRLSRAEVITMSAGILIAGYETTSNELAAAVYEMLRRPELVRRVRDRPEESGPVVEEILRYLCANGSGGVPHVATADVTLPGGVVVPAGEVVVPIPDAANHDPGVFEDPRCLRGDRAENPHLTFGFGAHYCLGAELARLEMRLGLTAVFGAFPTLRLAVPEEELRWRTDMFIRGLWELPVTW
ncbi:cytochrome P450 [Planomonospora sp. ID67723]|uniref:cytochrome P450 n=1 Tax=Planomonospora sp. ID67723 TaxID=2738134 RepID=UPI0018C3795E|nr:cytochrome P450 [Planomonospora sp. ID67723]MBG0831571.1 cytochrome P450 [Planomonospora sp. ID67723]